MYLWPGSSKSSGIVKTIFTSIFTSYMAASQSRGNGCTQGKRKTFVALYYWKQFEQATIMDFDFDAWQGSNA